MSGKKAPWQRKMGKLTKRAGLGKTQKATKRDGKTDGLTHTGGLEAAGYPTNKKKKTTNNRGDWKFTITDACGKCLWRP